ncbi:serine-threonine/tyrosine-protein kinase catalytic domain-containing protein [Artemisia annua]|uniref:Serine-threonine/tyrosine-protein kinase catalytic domain-containing protein n=1 Tax=Artemisia annua TaxID=35608 RepID=A0A2U1NKD4_ARTAN|nr:serine-threonine/tyrosine-protein kinase catalytic domain-containing protein [Artemisia annua]
MSSTGSTPSSTFNTTFIVVPVVVFVVIAIVVGAVQLGAVLFIGKYFSKTLTNVAVGTQPFNDDARFIPLAMVKFLDDMEREKPILFTSHQLTLATANFSIVLGSGAFGTVYKGIFSNGVTAAVKVLNGTSDKRIEEQFMAEVSTMGRTHHFNLVRLYGFCFDSSLRALVYEFMVNGSLDHHLFKVDRRASIGFEKLQEIALGTARGIAYLYEECPQRIRPPKRPSLVILEASYMGLLKPDESVNGYVLRLGQTLWQRRPKGITSFLWNSCKISQHIDYKLSKIARNYSKLIPRVEKQDFTKLGLGMRL